MSEHTQYHHKTPVQIRFNDLDIFKHVNNTTIQEYFDLGRMHYLNDVFNGTLFDDSHSLVIASIKTTFHNPILLKDKIEVNTKVITIGNKSLTMLQGIIDNDGVTKATCKSIMVCFRKKDFVTEDIPESWRTKFKNIENGDLK